MCRRVQDVAPVLPDGREHGTTRGSATCRPACDPCRAANTAAQRERRERRLTESIPEDAHGKPSTYSDRNCRCRRCKVAYREWTSTRRKRATKAQPDIALMPAEEHGTLRGYKRWACKCEPCREAGRQDRATRKLEQRGPAPDGPTVFCRYRYRIHLTPQVVAAMDSLARWCRFVHNRGLRRRGARSAPSGRCR